MTQRKKSVLIAMSGGVDSVMSALLLKQQGYRVIGIHFMMQENHPGREEAKRLADFLQIPLVIKDIAALFRKEVIDNFISAYQQNITPNPCVICNPDIKFHHLISTAEKMKVHLVATGHYAKIKRIIKQGSIQYQLLRADDQLKDQSYFLYRLTQPMLARIIFPLGESKKKTIQEMAERLQVPLRSAESQDVCFFSNHESLTQFLSKHEIDASNGAIIQEDGTVLGYHRGLPYYTQGQRTGLGLSGGPFYVVGKNIPANELIVTRDRLHPKLLPHEIIIKQTSWIDAVPAVGQIMQCKTRYRVRSTDGTCIAVGKDQTAVIRLHDPQWAVAAGQSLVVYDHDRVIGGGIIESFH